MYNRQNLGQEGSDAWVTSPDGTVMQNLDTGTVIVSQDPTSIDPVPVQPATSGGDWFSWGSLSNILQSGIQLATTVVRAASGQPQAQPTPPPGYRYDPVTNRMVPTATFAPSSTSWILPLGLLGIGAVLLLGKKR